jgi:hypothetical protein
MESKDADGNIFIKNNGVWTNTTINIPELIATYLKAWLEDSVPSDLLEGIKESKGRYTEEKQKETMKTVYGELFKNREAEIEFLIKNLETQYNEFTEETNNLIK